MYHYIRLLYNNHRLRPLQHRLTVEYYSLSIV
ncbi:hypothetical protein [Staphylococcus phage APTC_SA_12]|nr:MAG: hypothetical protein [Staphylococcus phage RP2]UPO38521.1 hypothetical protein [Staphylococcus phage vB_SaS_GE1]UWV20075.1 hypothetical protein [Staphylococcus phage APTC_SA_2]UWV20289.1 hypothetical protein [Staphylococcus phage APTC_SA_4]UWV20464.1 hypothetical protein [Staphylococcus phage APTC_SA_12]UWV20660.1 hypothetical protein [Staphylococcus phage APTC_SA_13]WDQ43997.1 hypothetical protein ESA2_CDS0 [Staphylococcus phage ESa2]WMT38780.1 hypothetical protein [Staphylococcus p